MEYTVSKRLTMMGLKESLDYVKTEVHGLRDYFSRLENKVDGLGHGFSNLQASVDQYLKRTETWHDEQVILKARHDRLSDALVRRGVVTKEETLL